MRILGLRAVVEGMPEASWLPSTEVVRCRRIESWLTLGGGCIAVASSGGFDIRCEECFGSIDLLASGTTVLDVPGAGALSSLGPCSSPGLVVGEPATASGVLDDSAPLDEAGDDCGSAVVEIGASTIGLFSLPGVSGIAC